MVSELETVDFAQCQAAMQRVNIPFSAAEAHGIAVGLFSAQTDDAQQHWVQSVYAELGANDVLANEAREQLDQVFVGAEKQLEDTEFGLHLFLPDEAIENLQRSTAIRDWAQGFLYGFGLTGNSQAALSEESQEALRDLYEIAQLDVSEAYASNDQIEMLVEIEEYMRVGVMMIAEDLRINAQPEGDHELH